MTFNLKMMQDKVEANGGRLRVSEALLRKSDSGKQAIDEGGERAESTETFPTVLHEYISSYYPHHVSSV